MLVQSMANASHVSKISNRSVHYRLGCYACRWVWEGCNKECIINVGDKSTMGDNISIKTEFYIKLSTNNEDFCSNFTNFNQCLLFYKRLCIKLIFYRLTMKINPLETKYGRQVLLYVVKKEISFFNSGIKSRRLWFVSKSV